MSSRKLESEIFGRGVEFAYSERWIGYSLLSLRLIMGWVFLYAGLSKVIDPEWSVRGYLNYAISPENPLRDFLGYDVWSIMANDWYWLLTPLNQVGLTLVGIALLLGIFVRLGAFGGALMMTFYWLASFPLTDAFVIDFHLVYVLLLFAVGAFGAGRILGLDAYLEELEIVEKYPQLRLLLG
ncbi:DoxX family protein [Halapricum salinum]|uniref:DoxX family protein n=1 Tax=Halapricum salinum TaxID=1457250 RepID=A0A4D6HBI8_9EURY|nr:DoxX family protein [Halapricum salinum]QCC50528.1 DoxX family protein [Halapricum salinum]